MPRPPPVRRGGWPCGFAPRSDFTNQINRHPAVLSNSPRPTVAERFNRTLKERSSMALTAIACGTPSAGSQYNAQWIVEKNGPEPRSSSSGVAHRDVTQARRMRQTCVQGTGCDTEMAASLRVRLSTSTRPNSGCRLRSLGTDAFEVQCARIFGAVIGGNYLRAADTASAAAHLNRIIARNRCSCGATRTAEMMMVYGSESDIGYPISCFAGGPCVRWTWPRGALMARSRSAAMASGSGARRLQPCTSPSSRSRRWIRPAA